MLSTFPTFNDILLKKKFGTLMLALSYEMRWLVIWNSI